MSLLLFCRSWCCCNYSISCSVGSHSFGLGRLGVFDRLSTVASLRQGHGALCAIFLLAAHVDHEVQLDTVLGDSCELLVCPVHALREHELVFGDARRVAFVDQLAIIEVPVIARRLHRLVLCGHAWISNHKLVEVRAALGSLRDGRQHQGLREIAWLQRRTIWASQGFQLVRLLAV